MYIFDLCCCVCVCLFLFFFFQAEDGIRDLVRSRGLGDVYKRQIYIYFLTGNFIRSCISKSRALATVIFSAAVQCEFI